MKKNKLFTTALMAALALGAMFLTSCKKTTPSVPVITIGMQPASTTVVVSGAITGSLTIEASVTVGTVQYQWYSADSATGTGGTPITGATIATLDIPTDLTPDTHYYFCEVSAPEATSVRSNVAAVTVMPPPVISIDTQPVQVTSFLQGRNPGTLTVAASANFGSVQYQWYSAASATDTDGTPITGATAATFTIPTDLAPAAYFYFCEVSVIGASVHSDVAKVVVWNGATRNYRITWEGGKYTLTTDPTDTGLFFKFGSAVGLFSGPNGANMPLPNYGNGDQFDSVDVAWNPNPVAVTDWESVPRSNGENINDEYHTVANVKVGKGDPCRLAGLDLARIKDADAGTLTAADIDNGIWRLPTNDENVAFVGTYGSPGDWHPLDRVNGHKFPDDDTFLPAEGYRYFIDGSVINQLARGYYWSSTPGGLNGYCLVFVNDRVYPSDLNSYTSAYGIRCVRQ